MANQQIERLFAWCHTSFTNARNEADVQAVLAPVNYTPEKMDEGLALLQAARDAYQQQQGERAEGIAATADLGAHFKTFETRYKRHLALARTAFEDDIRARRTLDLDGDRADDRILLIEQARRFYQGLDGNAALLATAAEVALTQAVVDTALADLATFEALTTTQLKEHGESQRATKMRDEAVKALKKWRNRYVRIATTATAEHPQLREKIGLLERS